MPDGGNTAVGMSFIPSNKQKRRPAGVAITEQEINSFIARADGGDAGHSSAESDWDDLGEEDFSTFLTNAKQQCVGAQSTLGYNSVMSVEHIPAVPSTSNATSSASAVIRDVGVDALFGSSRSNLSPTAVNKSGVAESTASAAPLVDTLFGGQSDSDSDDHNLARCEEDDDEDIGLSEHGAHISHSLASARRSARDNRIEREVGKCIAASESSAPELSSVPTSSSTAATSQLSVSSALAACAVRRKRALAELSMCDEYAARFTQTAQPADGTVQHCTKSSDSVDFWVAAPSNLKVHRPRISSELWRSRTADRLVLTLRQFISRCTGGQQAKKRPRTEVANDVLLGVIGSKLPPRRSKNDRIYSVWTLSDLDRVGPGAPDGCVKVFLFGNCHDKLWKETEGTVVAILSPKMMSDSTGLASPNGKDISVTLESGQHVMLLGQSPDYAICAAVADKNGRPCFRIVNKSLCRYCEFHVKKAYYKASSSRPGFVSISMPAFSGRGRCSRYSGDRQQSLCDAGVYSLPTTNSFHTTNGYEGKSLSAGRTKLNIAKLSAAGYQVDQSAGLTINKISKSVVNDAQHTLSAHSNDSASSSGRSEAGKSLTSPERKLLKALCRPTAGSLNLLRHLDSSEGEHKKATSRNVSNINQPMPTSTSSVKSAKQPSSSTFANFFASAPERHKPPSLPVSLTKCRRQLSSSNSNGFIDLGPMPSNRHSLPTISASSVPFSPARLRAAALVKAKGGLPAMQAKKDRQQRSQVLASSNSKSTDKSTPLSQILDSNTPTGSPNQSHTTADEEEADMLARKRRAEQLADLASRVQQGSSHAALIEEVENHSEQARLVQLERRDDLEQRLANQQEEPCTYVECKTCNYRAWKATPQCRRDQHSLAYIKGTKRHYRCRRCMTRTITFERYPKLSCSNCGESLFEKTSVIPERKGPTLPGEKLLPRGIEDKSFG